MPLQTSRCPPCKAHQGFARDRRWIPRRRMPATPVSSCGSATERPHSDRYSQQLPMPDSTSRQYPSSKQKGAQDVGLTPQEIRHQFLSLVRQHALGMELHTLNREILMSQAHDDAGSVFVRSPCADFQIAWQILLRDDQRMVARRSHGRSQAAKDGLAIVFNLAGLAMHQVLRAHHLAAKSCADGLVAEADSEQRHISLAREMADQFNTDARFLRSAGSGRKQDAFGVHRLDLSDGHFVVAANLHLRAQFAKVLDEVVSERIVVIEDEDHKFIVAPAARFPGFLEPGSRVCGSQFARTLTATATQAHEGNA